MPAFGFTFALARIRMTPRYFSPVGWVVLTLHGLLLICLILELTGHTWIFL